MSSSNQSSLEQKIKIEIEQEKKLIQQLQKLQVQLNYRKTSNSTSSHIVIGLEMHPEISSNIVFSALQTYTPQKKETQIATLNALKTIELETRNQSRAKFIASKATLQRLCSESILGKYPHLERNILNMPW